MIGKCLGRIGNGEKILAIDGHMDTVDFGNMDNWEFDPLSGEIKDGYVLGRGTVDQEGGPAAAVTSGRILKELAFDKNLLFGLLVRLWKKIVMVFVGNTLLRKINCAGFCYFYRTNKS